MEVEVTQAEDQWEAAKSFAAEKKKVFDGRVSALRQEIRRTNDPQQSMEFDGHAEIVDESHQLTPPGPKQLSPATSLPENPPESGAAA
jgi:hypothetical protein